MVTGGAGYIGSFTVRALKENGWQPVVFDNLVYGHRQAVRGIEFVKGDLLKAGQIEKVLAGGDIEGVVHFAAYALAGESMELPAKYFQNNTMGTLNLLEAMRKSKVKKIVFSSTSAVYGQPRKLPITEDEEKKPESPYGESKLMVEKLLAWYRKIFQFKFIALRYFNAAGAAIDGSMGEDHQPETHLIPVACQVALGQRKKMVIFGDDYKTPDGSCVRDYIHVLDLAEVHRLALKRLIANGKSDFFNVGTGRGYSVKEIVAEVKKTSGADFEVELGTRRPGDPAFLYADNRKICRELGWQPKHSDLKTIVSSAWKWHQSHPRGYE